MKLRKLLSLTSLILVVTSCKTAVTPSFNGSSSEDINSNVSSSSLNDPSSTLSSFDIASTSLEGSSSSVSSTNTSISSSESSSSEKVSSSSSEKQYATWPTEQIQALCRYLSPKCTEIIPSYDWASEIEINTDYLEDELYFGIYCYVDSRESEQIYINKLKENNWKTSDQKIESFFEAYSPDGTIWLNFMYDKNYKDLEIYVSEAPIVNWPEELINKNLNSLTGGTKTTIPSFSAELYVVNYYPDYQVIAINGYGVDDNITEIYKNKIEPLGWTVSEGSNDDEYDAISPLKDIEITFYYDEPRNEFNIDVQKKKEESTLWPKDAIAALVESKGLTGEVMEYKGAYSNVELDDIYYPPAIIVYVERGKQRSSAEEYNKMLLDNGYVVIGQMYGEDIYNLPGNTLAYHATYLTGNCFTIELFDIAKIK